MTLEAALQENTAAHAQHAAALAQHSELLQALLTRLGESSAAAVAGSAVAAAPKSAPAPAAASGTATATAPAADVPSKTGAAPSQPAASAGTQQRASTAATEPIAYDQVRKAILKLSAKDRDAAVAVLSGFGVTKGPDLKPEQYAAVLARIEELLA